MVLEYLKLFVTFAKIGMFTIGGGYAMIPLIEREIVANVTNNFKYSNTIPTF